MALAPVDETNLLLPLFDGLFEKPLWETFLRRLAQRTGADRVRRSVSSPSAPHQPPLNGIGGGHGQVLAVVDDQSDPGHRSQA